jgi:hypothetical protein
MRPFAPRFGKLVAGAQVYLLNHSGSSIYGSILLNRSKSFT